MLAAIGATVEEFFGGMDKLAPPEHGVPFPVEEWGLIRLGKTEKAPIIGWAQAGRWTPVAEDESAEDSNAVWSDSIPDGCYALEVQGDSMEPEFSEGDLIVVDPNSVPKNGDFAVVRIEGKSEAVFKQYKVKDNRHYLRALNTEYADIELTGEIEAYFVGVVVESKRLFEKRDRKSEILAKLISKLSEMDETELAAALKAMEKNT